MESDDIFPHLSGFKNLTGVENLTDVEKYRRFLWIILKTDNSNKR